MSNKRAIEIYLTVLQKMKGETGSAMMDEWRNKDTKEYISLYTIHEELTATINTIQSIVPQLKE